jgi:hypothetical protein
MLIFHHQNERKDRNIKIAKRSFENVSKFRQLGMAVRNQNFPEETKSTLNLGNACCHSVQNFCPIYCLKMFRIKTYKTIILPVVLYGCETWFPILREGHRLGVFENMTLRRTTGTKEDEIMGG